MHTFKNTFRTFVPSATATKRAASPSVVQGPCRLFVNINRRWMSSKTQTERQFLLGSKQQHGKNLVSYASHKPTLDGQVTLFHEAVSEGVIGDKSRLFEHRSSLTGFEIEFNQESQRSEFSSSFGNGTKLTNIPTFSRWLRPLSHQLFDSNFFDKNKPLRAVFLAYNFPTFSGEKRSLFTFDLGFHHDNSKRSCFIPLASTVSVEFFVREANLFRPNLDPYWDDDDVNTTQRVQNMFHDNRIICADNHACEHAVKLNYGGLVPDPLLFEAVGHQHFRFSVVLVQGRREDNSSVPVHV